MLTRDAEIHELHGERKSRPEFATGSRPLSEIVFLAVSENARTADQYGRDVVYNTPLWTFTRVVKSFFPDLSADEAFDLVEPEIETQGGWRDLCLDAIYSSSDAYVEFTHVWGRVRYLLGEGPLDVAIRASERTPLVPERCRLPGEPYARFVSLAAWLQWAMGNRPIALPCELVGDVLGVSAMSVSRYREAAVRHGYLTQTAQHSHAQRRASEFRFNLEAFLELKEIAP